MLLNAKKLLIWENVKYFNLAQFEHECPFCGKTFSHSPLNRHIQSVHEGKNISMSELWKENHTKG